MCEYVELYCYSYVEGMCKDQIDDKVFKYVGYFYNEIGVFINEVLEYVRYVVVV